MLKNQNSEISTINAYPSWDLNSIAILLDTESRLEYNTGDYSAWDVLNEKYKLKSISDFWIVDTIYLHFDDEYNIDVLIEEYKNIPGIKKVTPNGISGDSSDICLEVKSKIHYYIFDIGSVDCPAGCIYHKYFAYSIDEFFNVNNIGVFEPVSINNFETTILIEPQWFKDRVECRKRL